MLKVNGIPGKSLWVSKLSLDCSLMSHKTCVFQILGWDSESGFMAFSVSVELQTSQNTLNKVQNSLHNTLLHFTAKKVICIFDCKLKFNSNKHRAYQKYCLIFLSLHAKLKRIIVGNFHSKAAFVVCWQVQAV